MYTIGVLASGGFGVCAGLREGVLFYNLVVEKLGSLVLESCALEGWPLAELRWLNGTIGVPKVADRDFENTL